MRGFAILPGLVLVSGSCTGLQPEDPAPTDASTTAVEVAPARSGGAAAAGAMEPGATVDGDAPGSSVACAEDERTTFSCPTVGGKRISVCGKDGEVEYRFGAQQAELTIAGGRFGSVPFSGGGEAQIAFAKGDTRYIVFSRTVRTNFTAGEPNNPEFTDGVMVVEGERKIAEGLCLPGEAESVDVMAAEDYGGAQSELFFAG